MKSRRSMRFISLFPIVFCAIDAMAQQPDPPFELKYELIEDLRKNISISLKSALSEIPEDVKKELVKCKDRDDILKSPDYVQKWVSENVSYFSNIETAQSFSRLADDIKSRGEHIDGGDVALILEPAFLSMLNAKPFDLDRSITSSVIYWRENKSPNVKFSPQGLGEIHWIWKLNQPSRYEGILHVGLDVKKRTFICFEYGKGLYFPEGDILERIYTEIVQDPTMAGCHIGKDRKKD